MAGTSPRPASIAIDRERQGARRCARWSAAARRALAQGRSILIFPEGTRKKPGAPPDYKPGVAALYGQLGVACVPVALNSGLFWTGFIKRPGISFSNSSSRSRRPALRDFMKVLEERIETATARSLPKGGHRRRATRTRSRNTFAISSRARAAIGIGMILHQCRSSTLQHWRKFAMRQTAFLFLSMHRHDQIRDLLAKSRASLQRGKISSMARNISRTFLDFNPWRVYFFQPLGLGGRRGAMTDISRQIWDMKYRLKAPDGTPVDADVADTWARVALAAGAGGDAGESPHRTRSISPQALAGHRFLPAGRILAGAGTDRSVTLFNCFVMGTIPDSMDGIFSHLREAALTLQQGGGIGYDFSTLAAQGRAGERRRRGCVGPRLLHGCVGRDVPHHHERGLAPRRDDGDARLRSSRHRGLHRRQARRRAGSPISISRCWSATPSWRR